MLLLLVFLLSCVGAGLIQPVVVWAAETAGSPSLVPQISGGGGQVALSSDGTFILQLSDHNVFVRSTATGSILRTVPVSREKGRDWYSTDAEPIPGTSQFVIIASGRPAFFDANSGDPMQSVDLGPGNVTALSLSVSADGKTVAVEYVNHDDYSEHIAFVDAKARTVIRALQLPSYGLGTLIALSPDGTKLAVAGDRGNGNEIVVFNTEKGDVVLAINKPFERSAERLVFTPDAKKLIISDSNKGLSIWDAETGAIVKSLNAIAQDNDIIDFTLAPDGQKLFVSLNPAGLATVDMETAAVKTTFAPAFWKSSLVTPDGKDVIGWDSDKVWRVDAKNGSLKRLIWLLPQSVDALAYTADGHALLAVYGRKTSGDLVATNDVKSSRLTQVWDMSGKLGAVVMGEKTIYAPFTSPKRDRVFFKNDTFFNYIDGGDSSFVGLWKMVDPFSGKALMKTKTPENSENFDLLSDDSKTLLLSPDGSRAYAWYYMAKDEKIRIFDTKTTKMVGTLEGIKGEPKASAISSDGHLIAVATDAYLTGNITGGTRPIYIWKDTGELVQSLSIDTEASALVFSPDNTSLLVTGKAVRAKPVCYVYSIGKDIKPAEFECLNTQSSLAWSPDGKRMAAGGDDGDVTIREVATGTELGHIEGNFKKVTSLAFSPNGNELATGGEDGAIRIFNLQNFSTAATILPVGDKDYVFHLANGDFVASKGAEKSLVLVDGADISGMTPAYAKIHRKKSWVREP